jgi:lipoate-protein ligase B
MTRPSVAILELGRVRYEDALELQRTLREHRIAGRLDRDVLLLLEHEPTITLGRGTRAASLPLPPGELTRRGLTVAEVDRGGDVTWHGPGQLVGYPILDLGGHRQDLHWYLRQVEETLIGALRLLEIPADRNPGFTGVWTRGRKIASIGVHVRQWVTTHGFALNVTNDLRDFDLIIPCGIQGVEMTTVARELGGSAGRRPDGPATVDDLWRRTLDAVSIAFGRVFERDPVTTSLAGLVPLGTVEGLRAY